MTTNEKEQTKKASDTKDIQPHDCYDHASVIECDNVTDTKKCRICGKEWQGACEFDDEYD